MLRGFVEFLAMAAFLGTVALWGAVASGALPKAHAAASVCSPTVVGWRI